MAPVAGLAPYAVRAVPIAQKVLAAASITSSYVIVGSVFAQPVVMLIIISTLDQPVQISWDGVADAMPILAASTMILHFKGNDIVLPGDFGVYVKEIGNPTTGSLYVGAFST